MTACAITDHNHMGGCVEFQEECEAQGIKPLLGVEGYYTHDIKQAAQSIDERRETAIEKMVQSGEKSAEELHGLSKKALNEILAPYMYDIHQYHILFIAKNQKGWNNLVKLQSEAARLCTYNGRFLCDTELLRKYHEGIICTTACIGSWPAKCIENGNEEDAERYILTMKEIFGTDFYLEIQPLDIEQQHKVNAFYFKMHKQHNIPVVATNDVHWTNKEDYDDHDTLLCIGTGKYKNEIDRMHYPNDLWIKSEIEMNTSFEKQFDGMCENQSCTEEIEDYYTDFYQEAIQNTQLIADSVEEVKLGSPVPLFSKVKVPKNYTPEEWLTNIAFLGMYKYLSKHPECNIHEYEARLLFELNIINSKGFAPYMLAVKEYVTWANNNGCATGPGRGSAAGSLALFSIGVTKNIDPIKNQLLFSRFLTADRKDPPDIDVDFNWEHRDKVIHHLEDYYGKECVAHIGTYSTMGVKSGIKDVGRVLGIDFSLVNSINKKIDEINNKPGLTFKDLDEMKEGEENDKKAWQDFNKLEENNKELFRLARAFEGTPRNQGVHASGILVTPMPISDLFPMRYKDGVAITLYTGPQLEHYNSIKYDILGLKTLTIIQKTIDNLSDIEDIDALYEKAKIEDSKIWKYVSQKQTEGVFQIESDMMKGIIDMIHPTCFDDLGAINALGRPGPLFAGMPKEYGERKNGKAEINYPIRGCEDILDSTYGTIPYQEQLMLISQRIAGFNDMQADSLTRKTIAKKKVSMMPMLIRCHIFGKVNCEGPEGWEDDMHAPWYDPKGKYGGEIEGAIHRGYTEEEVLAYFHTIENFSSYCFNKSHSACYAYIGFLTAWLKHYYPAEFMAAVLSMQDTPEKVSYYVDVCEQKMKLKITTPDINLSGSDFTPNGKEILYGLGSVKNVGDKAIPDIIANRPYANIEEAIEKIPKKAFNKRIGENLIMAGAFDFENVNRNAVLNIFHLIRKDKIDLLDENDYNEDTVINMEQTALGAAITYKPWWDSININTKVEAVGKIIILNEREDKRHNLMAFPKLIVNNCPVEAMIFSSNYCKCAAMVSKLSKNAHASFRFIGKKNEKGTFQLTSIELAEIEE